MNISMYTVAVRVKNEEMKTKDSLSLAGVSFS